MQKIEERAVDGWSGHNWNSANIEKVGLNNLWPDGKIDLVRFFYSFLSESKKIYSNGKNILTGDINNLWPNGE